MIADTRDHAKMARTLRAYPIVLSLQKRHKIIDVWYSEALCAAGGARESEGLHPVEQITSNNGPETMGLPSSYSYPSNPQQSADYMIMIIGTIQK